MLYIRHRKIPMIKDGCVSSGQRSKCARLLIHHFTVLEEGNGLFNDELNTFYLRLYGVGHMVKDHSDSERGNPLPPLNGLFFSISSKGFYMNHPTDKIAHTTAFGTPVVKHWLKREMYWFVVKVVSLPLKFYARYSTINSYNML